MMENGITKTVFENGIEVYANHFDKARKLIEKKQRAYTPEFLRRLLAKSELRDDKEAIVWLEEYTKHYEQMQQNNRAKEHNAELSVDIIAFSPEDRELGRIMDCLETPPIEVSLTPEQERQNKIDLDNRKNRIAVKEEPKRGIETLRKQSEERIAPGR